MKLVSETKSIERLSAVRENFKSKISKFEARAKSCSTCATQGACCLDAHFVNVRISRLEAVAIARAIGQLDPIHRKNVRRRIDDAIARFHLDESTDATYACPLYQIGVGCLVHETAKPLACIAHACYESTDELPPEDLLDAAEAEIDKLNRRSYGNMTTLLPIPIALRRVPGSSSIDAASHLK